MNSTDLTVPHPVDIIIAGSSSLCVALYEALSTGDRNTLFLRSAPFEGYRCKTLVLEVSSLSQEWQSLLKIECDRLVLAVEEMPVNHLKQVMHFIQEQAQANQVWLSQNGAMRSVLTQQLAGDFVYGSPLLFLARCHVKTKVPSEKFQLGIHLHQSPDKAQLDFISSFRDCADINVRLFEEKPTNTAYLQSLPSQWSYYSTGKLSFEKFASLCDGIFFADETNVVEKIIKSAQSGALPIVPETARIDDPDIQGLTRAFDEVEGIRRFVQESQDQYGFMQQKLMQDVDRIVTPERLMKELSLICDQAISSTQKKGRETASPPPVLFVSTNGIGLGHVTRLLAVAKRCSGHVAPVFAVFSAGVRLVEEAGYPCEHMVSNEFAEVDPMGWHDHVNAELRAIIRQFNPACIVYDGNTMYPGVTQAISGANLPFLWIRRGLYRDSASSQSLHSQIYADVLCQPGELAAPYDKGPTADMVVQNNWPRRFVDVNPVTWVLPEEVLSKEDARKSLEIAPDGHAVLIQVGAGNLKDTDRLIERIVAKLNSSEKLDIYLAQWPIADRPHLQHDGVTALRRYPMSQCLNAFDFVISATGYNSFHELMLLGIPSLFIPNEFTRLDDQIARAQYAADIGAGLLAFSERTRELEDALEEILKPEVRQKIRQKAKSQMWQDGAQDIADWVFALAGQKEWPQ